MTVNVHAQLEPVANTNDVNLHVFQPMPGTYQVCPTLVLLVHVGTCT